MDDSIKVIKSLITASSGGGLLIKDINKEYKEEVGKSVPFNEFGFATLAEFLRSTNEFSATKTEHGLKVTVKIPGKSAHIIAMRQKQNVSQAEKKRRKKSMMTGRMGGAFMSSQQPKRSIPSQVMKRSGVMKQRTYAQPQRIASSNSAMKPMPRPPTKFPSTQMSTANKQPVNAGPIPAGQSQKVNLYDRFVSKQVFEPAMPSMNSMPTVPVPSSPTPTPTPQPVEFPHKSPQTPPTSPPPMHEAQSCRSKLMARLAAYRMSAPSDSSQTNSCESDTHTVVNRYSLQTPLTTTGGRLSRSELLKRLAPKQIPAPANSPIGRSALQNIDPNVENPKEKRSTENGIQSIEVRLQMNRSDSVSEHKQKPCEAVSLGKTMSRRDLYARLAPKQTDSENKAKLIGDHSQQSSDKPSTNGTHNQSNTTTNVNSRLQTKQIDAEFSELQQISQKVRTVRSEQLEQRCIKCDLRTVYIDAHFGDFSI